jgi:uncharacterized membrane protein YjgN (DUF898 family)
VGGQAITTARIQNAVWNRARLGSLGFICDLSDRALFWIQLSNLAHGRDTRILRPFAKVRLAKYVQAA